LKAKLTEADLERFLEDEQNYLEKAAPAQEQDDISISANYIHLLQKLYEAEYVVDHWHVSC
jgi:hypothetical protein